MSCIISFWDDGGISDFLFLLVAVATVAFIPVNLVAIVFAMPLRMLVGDKFSWPVAVLIAAVSGGLLYAVPVSLYFAFWLYGVAGDFTGSGEKGDLLKSFQIFFAIGATYGFVFGAAYSFLRRNMVEENHSTLGDTDVQES